MSLLNLDNLVKTGQLKIESFQQKEFMGLLLSGMTATQKLLVHVEKLANYKVELR